MVYPLSPVSSAVMKRPTIPDDRREHAAKIVAHFSALIHAWQTNQFAEAAEAQSELGRLGVKVSIPRRRVKGGAK